MGDLTKNFSRTEFTCRCGCGMDNVSMAFVEKLQTARTMAGVQFNIMSGCRCTAWNARVGGTPTSDHITSRSTPGTGADIACYDSQKRYRIIKTLLNAGFNRIGVRETFIHVGMKESNPQNVLWLY